jgi:predicted Zn finger-like uncharacterized protein
MIAACPKCAARYRIERERLHAGSVRLRCARCEAVFRVRPPEAPDAAPEPPPAPASARREPAVAQAAPPPRPAAPPAPAPAAASGELILVAMPDGELTRRTCDVLEQRGLRVLRANDGVEAMLEIQRRLPRAIVLAADLPKMYGFQICEVVKRNESLRGTWVVLVGAIHHRERYRRAPGELYGADAYVDGPELPAGLLPLLAQGGLDLSGDAARAPLPARPAQDSARVPLAARPPAAALQTDAEELVSGPARPAPDSARVPLAARPAQDSARVPLAARPAQDSARVPLAARPAQDSARVPLAARPPAAALQTDVEPPVAAAAAPRRSDGLDDERAKAERLARIVISDIVLYNEERFAAAVRGGNVLQAMAAELAEGRQLFEERVDPRVRAERDYLKDELMRRAQARGMR